MELDQEVTQETTVEVKAPENMLMGIIGALLGAVLGGVSIVLLSQLGYIASLSGALLAFCTLKGYELLGKQMSKKGLVICIFLMALTPFVADWIDWALVIMDAWADYGVTFGEALFAVPMLMKDGTIDMTEYLTNLGMVYLFVALGGFYTVKKAIKKQ